VVLSREVRLLAFDLAPVDRATYIRERCKTHHMKSGPAVR
jgi:hypothetical protein